MWIKGFQGKKIKNILPEIINNNNSNNSKNIYK